MNSNQSAFIELLSLADSGSSEAVNTYEYRVLLISVATS
jgi:hypothetical protein